MTVLEAYSEFSRNYLMARCYSQKTIDDYWWVIRSFVQSAGNIDTQSLDIGKVADWIEFMKNVKNNKKTTIHTNVSNIRVFVDYINLNGMCTLRKEQIAAPKKPRNRHIKWAPVGRVEALINACPNIRDRAIVAVMFSGALRNSELRNLKRADVHETDLFVENGKGDESRRVDLDEVSKELLDRYLVSRTDKSTYMFVTNRGDRIAPSTLRYIFAYASKRAGVDHTNPHQVRHGAATALMNGGMHMRKLQVYLGHEYITTTEIYTHVTNQDLKVAHALALPKLHLTA